ncbi:iron-uptake system-binding protein [Trichonephila clavipes]|nr:iron-uptake system-binding protein [Trichonephila clavipes]
MLVKQHVVYLKLLAKSKTKRKILQKCPNSLIKAVCECALNTLKGNVPLTKHHKRRLAPFKQVIRKLGDKSVPLYKKRKVLIQKGEGFLSFLIPAAVSVISSLILMEHSKKFVLLSEERLQNFLSEQLSELDEQMQSILRNKNMNDSEKVTLYLKTLRKYVNFPFPKEINRNARTTEGI